MRRPGLGHPPYRSLRAGTQLPSSRGLAEGAGGLGLRTRRGESGAVSCEGGCARSRFDASREAGHEAMKSRLVRGRPRRSGAACWRITVSSVHVAALTLFAHLLVAAHTASHFSKPTPVSASQHCVICAVGKHAPGDLTAVIAGHQYMATWLPEPASPPPTPMLRVERAVLARAPPSQAPAFG